MKKLALFFLLALLPLSLSAQTEEWDRALDQYESITLECIRLKQELAGGGNVSVAELRTLAGELNDLKARLHGASGQMTAVQRKRLALIRKMYAEGVPVSTVQGGIPRITAFSCLSPHPPAGVSAFHQDIKPATLPVRKVKPSGRPFVLLTAGIINDVSYGMMAGETWQRWGFYASARSNLVSSGHAYECTSDGSVPDGSIIWTSGKSKVSRLNLAAGVLWNPLDWASFYVGGGYGTRRILWQDSDGEWVEVSDASRAGLVLDAGILLRYDKLVFSIGSSVLPAANPYADLSVGVGYVF